MSEMSWEHAAEARAALNEIVNDPQYGAAALSNGPTMSNLLKDLLPDAPREKSILVAAAEAGLAGTLREHVAQGMDTATATRLAASSFAASTPFTPDACTWVAGEIAIALGLSQPGAGGAGLPAGPGAGGPADPQAMPTQVAPIPGYQPGQQGAGAGPTVPGSGQQGGWQPGGGQQGAAWQPAAAADFGQPAQPSGWQQPAGQPGGWQQPAQPGGWQQPAQPGGWQQPAQPGGWQPGQPGYGPGGPTKPRRSKRGWFIGGGAAVVLIIVIAIAASLAGTNSSTSSGGGGGGTHTPTSTPTPTPPPTSPGTPVLPAGVDPLATIFHPSSHAPPGSDCSSTANTNTQNLDPATIVAATFCDRTFSPYTHISVWAYQFDSKAHYLTAVSRLNHWTGYDNSGPTNHTCPPGTNPRGKTGWHSITNPKYHTQRSDQFLECYTDHVKSAGGSAQAFLLWTLPSQYVIFVGRNTQGNSAANFTYLVRWWEHIAYA